MFANIKKIVIDIEDNHCAPHFRCFENEVNFNFSIALKLTWVNVPLSKFTHVRIQNVYLQDE